MRTKRLSPSHLMHVLGLALFLADSAVWAGDWHQWRGPNRDNVSAETDLLDHWHTAPKLLWQADEIGDGYASPVVANGVVYTIGNHNGRSMDVVALRVNDGKRLWKTSIGPARTGGHSGSRSTPTVDGDCLYALHPNGSLVCLKAATGELVWNFWHPREMDAVPMGHRDPVLLARRVVMRAAGPATGPGIRPAATARGSRS